MYGERTIEVIGSTTYEDFTNQRKAVICFNTYKKTGWFSKTVTGQKDGLEGLIYKCEPLVDDPASIKYHYSKEQNFVTEIDKLKDVVKPLVNIEGSWLSHLSFDDTEYWNIRKQVPTR